MNQRLFFSFLLFCLASLSNESIAQFDLPAYTENYGTQTMDGSQLNNGDITLRSDGPGATIWTYDMEQRFDVENAFISSFTEFRIPSSSTGSWPTVVDPNDPTLTDPSVFQAHWRTQQVSNFLSSEFGWNYSFINVAANYFNTNRDPVQGLLISDFDDCHIALGSYQTSTYAETEIIAGLLGVGAISNLSPIAAPPAPSSEILLLRNFARIIGVYAESQIEGLPIDYNYGEKTPIPLISNVDFSVRPSGNWNANFESTHLEHWFYLVTNNSIGINAVNEKLIIDYLINAFLLDTSDEFTSHTHIRDRVLLSAELDFGVCSSVYRSIANAFNQVLRPEQQVILECCDAGDQVLTRNTTIDATTHNGTFQFNGNLIVPSGITLTIDYQSDFLTFPPNTGLIVQNGGELIINVAQIKSCDDSQKWRGIVLEDGSRFINSSLNILNAQQGVNINNLATGDLDLGSIRFDDCAAGVKLTGITNNNFVLDGQNTFSFFNCHQAVLAANSVGTIQNLNINSTNNIGIEMVDSDLEVYNNQMICKRTGIIVRNDSEAIIGSNFSPNHITAPEGIVSTSSTLIADGNNINATVTGISHIFSFDPGSRISDNVITLNGNNDPANFGVYSFLTDDLTVRNNLITGTGHKASIFARNSQAALIERNTTDAPNSSNGIALEGGGGSVVNNNDIQGNPNNAIGAWHSNQNHFDDNNIAAKNVGLYIGDNLVEDQTITCNRFCEGAIDLRIGSEIGAQDHHENRFRTLGSKAIALNVDPSNNERYRFGYQLGVADEDFCDTMNLFAVDDVDNVFVDIDGTSIQSCLNTQGSTLPGLTEDILCEHLADNDRLNAKLWYAKLKLLLGRYFATHGPQSLPTCLQDCDPAELMRMEAELRLSGNAGGQSDELDEMAGENLKTIASRQYQQLGGQGIVVYPDLLPCIDTAMVETIKIHTETYKFLLKHISTGSLDEADLMALKNVAELCESQYGEVVSWAQGLLATYRNYDYLIAECSGTAVEGRSRSNVETALTMRIAPIPASDELYIDIEGLNQAGILTITDVTGRQILTQKVNNNGLIHLDLSSTQNGLYFVTLSYNTVVQMTETIIIQK